MSFDADFNKNYISNIPYLDGAIYTSYTADISSIINNDISGSNIYNNVSGLNNAFYDYLEQRDGGSAGIGNSNSLDQQLLLAYKSNNEMIKQLTQHKIEKYKQIKNLETHINNSSGNNTLLTIILDGSGNDYVGDISNVENKIKDLKQEVNDRERNLEINTYYEKKYLKQYQVIRNIVFLLALVLGVSFLFKSGFFGEKIFVSIIGLLLAFSIIYISYEVYDIFMRDNHNFDEYKYYTRPNVGLSDDNKNNVDIPLELRADIPGFCKLKDDYLNL